MESSDSSFSSEFDYLFKLLMIGDSGVGKGSLLSFTPTLTEMQNLPSDFLRESFATIIQIGGTVLHFSPDTFDHPSPTIGVDLKVKYANIGGKKLKLAIWDTVYDVTRRETFTNLSEIWSKEIDLYSTNQDCIKMLVGNKVDQETESAVTRKRVDFAREYGCLFIECSAKTRVNVHQCFEELVLKILDTASLLFEGSKGVKKNIFHEQSPQPDSTSSCC